MTLLAFALAWLAGIVFATLEAASIWPFVVAGAAGAAAGFMLADRYREALLIAGLAAIAIAGLFHYESARPSEEPGGVAVFNDAEAVELSGVVNDDGEERGRSQRFTLRVQAVRKAGDGWQPSSGSVLVTTRPFPRFRYGDRLELRGRLETPPSFDGFDYREYLARQGVVSLAAFPRVERVGTGGGSRLVRAIDDVRRPLNDALARALPEPEAALAQGILLGQRSSIPRDLTDDFNASGISHLVAISGYNVMLAAGFGLASLSWLLGKKRAVVTSMLLVVVFAVFVGASPSVLRAALMAVVMLGARLAGRPGSGLTAVCLAAALLTLWQPLIVDDVAFQLSVAATAGIVLLARPLEDAMTQTLTRRLPEALATWLAGTSAMTLAASLAVLPVIASAFGRVSIVALPANLLAGFALPFILATSFIAAIAGSISEGAGQLFGEVAYLPLAYLVFVGRTAADVPGASLDLGQLERAQTLALTAAVVVSAFAFLRLRHATVPPEPRRPVRVPWPLAGAALLFLASPFTLAGAFEADDGRLRFSVLDVGQGDAILIETPAGHRILVDGGPSGGRITQALGRELPAGTRRVDLVVLTHGQDDHVTGLITVLERYDVGAVLRSPLNGSTAAFKVWTEALARESVPVREAVAGEWVDLGAGARLEVLAPPVRLLRDTPDDLNNNSVVLRLVYGDVSFLLTGDLASDGEEALLRGAGSLRSTVLKVGHHGSDGSSTSTFLAAVRPDYAVISVGAENSFGHPSPTTQLRLAGVPLLRTDVNGRVRFETDGRRLWASFDRGEFRRITRPGR